MIDIPEITAFQNKPQQLSITIKNIRDAEELYLTNADIIESSFSLNRYCLNGDFVQPGGCIQSEVIFTLENHDGRFDSYPLELGFIDSMSVSVESDLNPGTTLTCPLGKYDIPTRNGVKRGKGTITITAKDHLSAFDYPIDLSLSKWANMYSKDYILEACSDRSFALNRTANDYTAYDYNMISFFYRNPTLNTLSPSILRSWMGDSITYRQILTSACALNACYGFINTDGKLSFMPLLTPERALAGYVPGSQIAMDPIPFLELSPQNIFASQKGSIEKVRGLISVSYYPSSQTVYYPTNSGLQNYVQMTNNHFLASGSSSVAQDALQYYEEECYNTNDLAFSYVPFQAETLPFPNVFPGDAVRIYTDVAKTKYYDSFVSHYTYKLNGRTQLMCVGL